MALEYDPGRPPESEPLAPIVGMDDLEPIAKWQEQLPKEKKASEILPMLPTLRAALLSADETLRDHAAFLALELIGNSELREQMAAIAESVAESIDAAPSDRTQLSPRPVPMDLIWVLLQAGTPEQKNKGVVILKQALQHFDYSKG